MKSVFASCVVLATASAHGTAANLLLNGSFETGTTPHPVVSIGGCTAQHADWRPMVAVDRWSLGPFGQHYWMTNPAMAQDGNRFIHSVSSVGNGGGPMRFSLYYYHATVGLNTAPLLPTPESVIALNASAFYRVSLWAADAGASFNGVAASPVLRLAGNAFSIPIDPTWSDAAASIIPWRDYTAEFTGAAAWHEVGGGISFLAPGSTPGSLDGPGRLGVHYDNVRLEMIAVPEPGVTALAAGALLAGLRRRRQTRVHRG